MSGETAWRPPNALMALTEKGIDLAVQKLHTQTPIHKHPYTNIYTQYCTLNTDLPVFFMYTWAHQERETCLCIHVYMC